MTDPLDKIVKINATGRENIPICFNDFPHLRAWRANIARLYIDDAKRDFLDCTLRQYNPFTTHSATLTPVRRLA